MTTRYLASHVNNAVFVVIYQIRRQNNARSCIEYHPTCTIFRHILVRMTVPVPCNQVDLDASWYKASATLFHCWYLLT